MITKLLGLLSVIHFGNAFEINLRLILGGVGLGLILRVQIWAEFKGDKLPKGMFQGLHIQHA
jgi:hypothetical protein